VLDTFLGRRRRNHNAPSPGPARPSPAAWVIRVICRAGDAVRRWPAPRTGASG